MQARYDTSIVGEPLWEFALRLYGSEGVSTACLYLQDRHGADVPLLLYAAWVGAVRVHALTEAEARHARDAVSAWHDEIVRPMRAVRRRMKTGPAPAPGPDTEALRERLKSVELGAEKVELAMLERLAPSPGSNVGADARTITRNMVQLLECAEGLAVPEDALSLLQDIARAASALASMR